MLHLNIPIFELGNWSIHLFFHHECKILKRLKELLWTKMELSREQVLDFYRPLVDACRQEINSFLSEVKIYNKNDSIRITTYMKNWNYTVHVRIYGVNSDRKKSLLQRKIIVDSEQKINTVRRYFWTLLALIKYWSFFMH